MNYSIEAVANAHCACGENPFYDAAGHRVLWTDIPNGRLFSLDLDSGDWRQFYKGPVVGGFTLQSDGALLLFRDHDIARLNECGDLKVLCRDIDAQTGRFNDVIADPEGRVFAGTMGNGGPNGGLYRVDRDGSVRKLWDGTGCSNGMGWTPDGSGFYWTDSSAKTIFRFDYDQASGELSNRQAFFVATPEMATPDGLTIDADGNVWSAFYGGACLRKISPQGEVRQEVPLPVANITSCAFGGHNYDELFVTTAGGEDDADSADGTLYRVRVGAKGRAEFSSRILLD